MDKKVKLYTIILVNLLAWGYVGYKVYTALQSDGDVDSVREITGIKKINETIKEEKMFIASNYPDPFLKNGNFSNVSANTVNNNISRDNFKSKHTNQSITTSTVNTRPAMDIKYLGLLKNNDKGTQTAMLSVNGRSVFVKQNDMVEGFLINEISGTFIKIKKGKEVMIISK